MLVPTLCVGTEIGALRHGTQSVRWHSHAERGNERDCLILGVGIWNVNRGWA